MAMQSLRVVNVVRMSKFGGKDRFMYALADMVRVHGGTVHVLTTDATLVQRCTARIGLSAQNARLDMHELT